MLYREILFCLPNKKWVCNKEKLISVAPTIYSVLGSSTQNKIMYTEPGNVSKLGNLIISTILPNTVLTPINIDIAQSPPIANNIHKINVTGYESLCDNISLFINDQINLPNNISMNESELSHHHISDNSIVFIKIPKPYADENETIKDNCEITNKHLQFNTEITIEPTIYADDETIFKTNVKKNHPLYSQITSKQ